MFDRLTQFGKDVADAGLKALGLVKADKLDQFFMSMPQSPVYRADGEPTPTDFSAQCRAFKSYVYTCASKNAWGVANVPLRLYVARDSKTNKGWYRTRAISKRQRDYMERTDSIAPLLRKAVQVEEITDGHPFLDVLRNVNPFMNRPELLYMIDIFQELTGNAALYIVKNRLGVPQEFWIIPFQNMKVVPGDTKFIQGYVYHHDGWTHSQEPIYFDESEIVHFKFPNPNNPYYGLSPMMAVASAVNLYQKQNEYETDLVDNDARMDFVVRIKGRDSVEKRELVKKSLMSMHGRKGKRGLPGIISQDMEIETLDWSPKEMAYLQGRAWSRDEIAAAYGVPKSKLTTDDVNMANAKAGEYQWAKDAIQPRLVMVQEKFNEKVLPLYDSRGRLFVAFDNPVPEEAALRLREKEVNIKLGFTTINEERDVEGWPPVAWGDEPILQPGVAPLNPSKPQNIQAPAPALSDEGKRAEFIGKVLDRVTHGARHKMNETVYWRQFVGINSRVESSMAKAMRDYFGRQVKAVQERLGAEKSVKAIFTQDKIEQLMLEDSEWNRILALVVSKYLLASVKNGGEFTYEILRQMVGEVVTSFKVTNPLVQEFLKEYEFKLAQEINATTVQQLRETLIAGHNAGETIEQIRDRISEVFIDANQNRAELIARSETIRASNAGANLMYKQSDGVVVAQRWLAAEDERLCPFCAELNGKIVGLDENFLNKGETLTGNVREVEVDEQGNRQVVTTEQQVTMTADREVPYPPAHGNCRCCIVPVLASQYQEEE